MTPLAPTFDPPYYAVVFSSLRTAGDDEAYGAMADRMTELAAVQPGFLGVESVRRPDGTGITVSYWRDLEAVRRWRQDAEHRVAQANGRSKWYESYRLRVCRVESETQFERERR
jgi:heme-degrading monooxygenase HmoA